MQPSWCWGLQASSSAGEVQVVEVCELYTQVVPFECGRRQQVRELGLRDPHGARRPHADPTWASLKAAPPRQRDQMRGLQRGSPFLLCLGYGAAEGLRQDPARSLCGTTLSKQLLRGHERPARGTSPGTPGRGRDSWDRDSWSGDSTEPQTHREVEAILEPRKPFKNQQQLNQNAGFILL